MKGNNGDGPSKSHSKIQIPSSILCQHFLRIQGITCRTSIKSFSMLKGLVISLVDTAETVCLMRANPPNHLFLGKKYEPSSRRKLTLSRRCNSKQVNTKPQITAHNCTAQLFPSSSKRQNPKLTTESHQTQASFSVQAQFLVFVTEAFPLDLPSNY